MKIPFLVTLICCYNISAFSQNRDIQERQNFIEQTLSVAAQYPVHQGHFNNTPRSAIKMPASLLKKPGLLKQFLKQQLVKNEFAATKANRNNAGVKATNLCEDTSYSRLLGVYNGFLYIESVTKTMDGGLLIPAFMFDSTRLPNPWWRSYGLLIKLDGNGNVAWLKQFEDLTPGPFSNFYITRAFELSNNDIICTGLWNASSSSSVYKTMIYRLTAAGNIIWQNCLQSTIGIFNSPPGTFTFSAESAVEGMNGDMILCGTSNSNLSSGHIETVIRLNSLGQLVWDANYGNHGVDGSYLFGAEGVTAFVQNGQIILIGLSHGTNNPQTPAAVNFLTLDYNNGNLLAKRFFRPSYSDPLEEFEKTFTYYANKCIRLSNGHILFYGKLFSDFMNITPVKDHFGVIEFDASFNLLNSYTISSGLTTNYYNNLLHFDPSGNGLVSVLEYLAPYEGNVFFASFMNQQFQNQRKAHYVNAGMPGNNGFAYLNDNSYAYVQTYFEDQPITKSYFEFRKMHNSDTSSQCLGKDTMLLGFIPLTIIEDPGYLFLDPNEPNKMVALPQNISQTDTTSTSRLNPCLQTNYCDTVKIHGNPVICGSPLSIIFTAFKNTECGANVQWSIDNNAIDSLRVLTDSSVRIWFKNINWQGKLYAFLPAGTCYGAAEDSITVSVISAAVLVNLGPDTVLCNQNSLVLHAGNIYSSYLWQDGSTDSVLTVVTPGIYWVHVIDACGNSSADSITISPFNVSISIGPDRTKCNNDTLQLVAPSGFLNYNWGPAYNINTLTGQQVIVNPAIDTIYFVKAEKIPGCFAYDTVRIDVNQSLPIILGADKNFCIGDSATLNAGNGFSQYQWSNGSSGQQIVVYSTGNYSVIGTTMEGCKSFDTLRIVNVWPKPVVTLNDNPELCTGNTRILQAGNFLSYLWQDGSTASSFIATSIGTYYVTVTDNNQCKGSDTARIIRLLPLPAGFLPADTAICNYGSLLIKPVSTYSNYMWSNNAASSSILVTVPGTYWLQVTDASNCVGRDTIIVNPKECLKGFHIPTAFTPDNNGRNDDLKPLISGIVKQYQFTIYNRWGQIIFTTKDLTKGWNGNFKGIQQDTNVFAWLCTYQLEGEAVKIEKGTVLLIR